MIFWFRITFSWLICRKVVFFITFIKESCDFDSVLESLEKNLKEAIERDDVKGIVLAGENQMKVFRVFV